MLLCAMDAMVNVDSAGCAGNDDKKQCPTQHNKQCTHSGDSNKASRLIAVSRVFIV